MPDQLEELRSEALAWKYENPNRGAFGDFPNRSCWNCNGAHEHLKNVDYPFECFECGNLYYKGINLSIE